MNTASLFLETGDDVKNWAVKLSVSAGFISIPACAADEPPSASVHMGDITAATLMGSYEWNEGATGGSREESVVPPQAVEMEDLEAVEVEAGADATVALEGAENAEIDVLLWNEQSVQEELASGTGEFTVPSEEGEHIIEIFADWGEQGYASYTLFIDVSEEDEDEEEG
ncbi:hypothetical protein [Bacillus daqingensis]|uniref:hypothetical protein n=1 Tax=Bacillus daqingensis TaxID=872396 RepID=UPI003F832119